MNARPAGATATRKTAFGPYEVLARIGVGGMGEVFRARDTRLSREVAVKVLPRELVGDPDRLRRFEQETRTLASLNHPNILTVYDVGVEDGAPYLVTELLGGGTLREELGTAGAKLGESRGSGLPLPKALEYACQIALGLAAAHQRGIIHRDLKPENLFVTTEGRVKILDFGLAKPQPDLSSQTARAHPQTAPDAPTLAASTQPGMLLGTPAYMSPEQVRGEPADPRSDIFAFGCVLYEMLAGVRVFQRDTAVGSMNAILADEPPELSAVRPGLPAVLERVVFRCLEKRPENRFQSVKDLGFALENLLTSSTGSIRPIDGRPAPRRFRAAALAPWAIAGLCIAGALGFILARKNPSPELQDQARVLRRFDLTLPAPAHKTPVTEVSLSISPDGKKFFYVNGDGLWVRRLDAIAPAVLLIPGDHITAAFWSPQSTEVGYLQGRHLYRVAVAGGTPMSIGTTPEDSPYSLPGGAWLGDRIVFTTGTSGLLQIPALGGSVEPVLAPAQGERDFHNASALPDGRGVLFVVHRQSGPDTIALWTPQGQRKVLLQIPGGNLHTPAFSPTGHVLFRRMDRGRGLWAFAFSLEKLQRTDEPFRVSDTGSTPSVAADGTLLLSLTDSELFASRQLDWMDRSGKILGTVGSPMTGLSQPTISPDGQRVLAIAGDSIADFDIWLFDLAAGGATQLTRNDQADLSPRWSNRGQTVLFTRRGESGSQVLVKAVDGPGAEQPLIEGETAEFSSSGKYLFLWQSARSGQPVPKFVRVAEKPWKPVSFPESLLPLRGYVLSPDEQRLAYVVDEADIPQVYLVDFPGFTNRWKVSRDGGHNPRWSRTGRELFYLGPDNRALFSARFKADAKGAQEPTKLCDLPESISAFPSDYDVAPDGDRFLMLQNAGQQAGTAARANVRVVLNWFEEFRNRK